MAYWGGWQSGKGNVMGYALKSGLGKLRVYNLCKQYLPEGVEMPRCRECNFRSYRNTYWLDFHDADYQPYRITFSYGYGRVYVRTEKMKYNDYEMRYVSIERFLNYVPIEYLLENNFLREVA